MQKITSPSLWYPIEYCIGTTFCGFCKYKNTIFVYSKQSRWLFMMETSPNQASSADGRGQRSCSAVSKTQLPTKGTTGQRREHASAAYFRYPRPRLHLTSQKKKKKTKPQLAELGKYKVGASECQYYPEFKWLFLPLSYYDLFSLGVSQTKKKSSWNSSMLEKNSIHASFFLGVDWHTLATFPKNLPCAL